MKSIFREPLLHFILLGGALFIGHGIWARHVVKTDYTIQVSPAEIERQAAIFASENRRAPTDDDIQALLFAHVEEQALMREAQRLGLDDNDTIIRRRLAQKMRFMIQDVDAPKLPNEAELKAWLETHKAEFIQPETRTFRHVYFSPANHESIEADAEATRALINDENWNSLGDPFMLARANLLRDQTSITRSFGRDFAGAIFALPKGGWSDPIESALGLHLVKIDDIVPETTPSFVQARDQVEAAWLEQAERAANIDRLENLVKKYKVVVEE